MVAALAADVSEGGEATVVAHVAQELLIRLLP